MKSFSRRLVRDAKRGDALFFHYSGHGGQEDDPDGIEEDGYNETIIPCDFQRTGQISDDILWKRLVNQVPDGCHPVWKSTNVAKSFLGDGAAVLARLSGAEPAWPRHRAGAASMA